MRKCRSITEKKESESSLDDINDAKSVVYSSSTYKYVLVRCVLQPEKTISIMRAW